MATLEVPGGELWYADSGAGPPVVLLHGGALDHRMWQSQVPAVVSRGRAVTPDVRGHGRSSTPLVAFRHCDDVAALVRHLDSGPATMVGLSLGAGIATDTALEHPDLVHALVVSGAGTSEPSFHDPWVLGIQSEMDQAQTEQDATAWVDAFVRYTAGPHRDPDEVDPEVLAYCREAALHTITAHARPDAVAAQGVAGPWHRLGEIAVPVLAIVGALDSDDHLGMAARLVGSVARGATVTIEDTAHYPNMERPEEFNAALVEFLDRTGA